MLRRKEKSCSCLFNHNHGDVASNNYIRTHTHWVHSQENLTLQFVEYVFSLQLPNSRNNRENCLLFPHWIVSTLKNKEDNKPILCLYMDGGPDHRLTYLSVLIALICLFLRLNMDMLIAVRTPPHNSWKKPLERVMLILNKGLQCIRKIWSERSRWSAFEI